MNRKGLTLVEVLTTLVIMSLVVGFGTYSITNIINESKLKSQDAFEDSIEDAMDMYISGLTLSYTDKAKLDVDPTASTCTYKIKTVKKDVMGRPVNAAGEAFDAAGNPIDPSEYVYVFQNVTENFYKIKSNFDNVINSKFSPIKGKDLVNPANEKKGCVPTNADGTLNYAAIPITMYRSENNVYYYNISKGDMKRNSSAGDNESCFSNVKVEEVGGVKKVTSDRVNYISNLPEEFTCS